MIQKTTQRQLNAVFANRNQVSPIPAEWGKLIDNKYYSLEVTQHPLRARMCGFGDKDRRPLAPAAVAKMIVRREDDTILDVDDVDVDFFVVTVDLWSADGTQETNLVLHPSSGERYIPSHALLSKVRKKSGTAPTARTEASPPRSAPYMSPRERLRPPTNHDPPPNSSPSQSNSNLDISFRHIESTPSGLVTSHAYPIPAADPFADANPLSPPSIHTFRHQPPADGPSSFTQSTPKPEFMTFHAWNDPPPVPPAVIGAKTSDNNTRWSNVNEPVLKSTGSDATAPTISTDPWDPPPVPHLFRPLSPETTTATPSMTSSLRYTRTLMGPLCANAQRLQDEHRKPGIFFLFQDLSIRTEGTFRLRMRLMNVGMSPAPNEFANSVHTGPSPVLAQIFTEPFTVYSAKRFPGVPDTTALSIAFGNQGQKLPLRNRHSSSKRQRRLRRPGADLLEDDSS